MSTFPILGVNLQIKKCLHTRNTKNTNETLTVSNFNKNIIYFMGQVHISYTLWAKFMHSVFFTKIDIWVKSFSVIETIHFNRKKIIDRLFVTVKLTFVFIDFCN